jgi:site-specific DNA-cytosine methylase
MTLTFGSLFQGFGLVDVGAMGAGITPIWGIEYDKDLASVAKMNGLHPTVIDILDADPKDFECTDVLHASPPCTNASTAKTNGHETDLDRSLARKVVEFLTVLRPEYFTLENVWAYRKFDSWSRIIMPALDKLGYWFDVAHVDFSDFGVPQSRKRMIVRAHLGVMVPHLPKKERPKVGWYQAIEDLIPILPESKFADWQLARLPEEMQIVSRNAKQPASTVVASGDRLITRAFLMNGAGNTNFLEAHPGKGVKYQEELSSTITVGDGGSLPRAFLYYGQGTRSLTVTQSRPSMTITSNSNQSGVRAFIVDGQNTRIDGNLSIRRNDKPALTVSGSVAKGMARAWLSQGCVVSMTPRCLARFQTLPDWYKLPDKTGLACKGIGNGVPCVGYQKIITSFVEAQR